MHSWKKVNIEIEVGCTQRFREEKCFGRGKREIKSDASKVVRRTFVKNLMVWRGYWYTWVMASECSHNCRSTPINDVFSTLGESVSVCSYVHTYYNIHILEYTRQHKVNSAHHSTVSFHSAAHASAESVAHMHPRCKRRTAEHPHYHRVSPDETHP